MGREKHVKYAEGWDDRTDEDDELVFPPQDFPPKPGRYLAVGPAPTMCWAGLQRKCVLKNRRGSPAPDSGQLRFSY